MGTEMKRERERKPLVKCSHNDERRITEQTNREEITHVTSLIILSNFDPEPDFEFHALSEIIMFLLKTAVKK